MSYKKNLCVYMSYKKKLCVYMSFNIKRHIYTSVISWCNADVLSVSPEQRERETKGWWVRPYSRSYDNNKLKIGISLRSQSTQPSKSTDSQCQSRDLWSDRLFHIQIRFGSLRLFFSLDLPWNRDWDTWVTQVYHSLTKVYHSLFSQSVPKSKIGSAFQNMQIRFSSQKLRTLLSFHAHPALSMVVSL